LSKENKIKKSYSIQNLSKKDYNFDIFKNLNILSDDNSQKNREQLKNEKQQNILDLFPVSPIVKNDNDEKINFNNSKIENGFDDNFNNSKIENSFDDNF
jgi:hypothetical protein